jgi:hypothetical protein
MLHLGLWQEPPAATQQQQQQQQCAARALCVAATHPRPSPQAWTYRPSWQQQQHWQQRRQQQQPQQLAPRLCLKAKVAPSNWLAQWTRLLHGLLLLLLVVRGTPNSSSSNMRLPGAAWLVVGCKQAGSTSSSSSAV